MFRRALTMAVLLGFVLGSADESCAAYAAESLSRLATERDSGTIPPKSADAAAQKGGKITRTGQRAKATGDGWWATLAGLAAVLALVFVLARIVKKKVPAVQKTLPSDVVQVLGRKALDYRHTIHLVRFGSRMLMLGVSQEGMTTLSEITDPVEIDYLAGLCKPSEPASVAQSFSQLFQTFQTSEKPRPTANPDVDEETDGAPDVNPGLNAESDRDPAILRLQERLQTATTGSVVRRSGLTDGKDSNTTGARA